MVYSDTSLKQGILEDIDFLLGTDSSDYPTAQKTRNINRWYDVSVSIILQADGKWEWDDLNATDLPIATTSLAAERADYSIDTTFLEVTRVECKDENGNWIKLKQFNQTELPNTALGEFLETSGTPELYDLRANSIILYAKPSYASSGGLKVYFKRNVSYFTASDTTKEPGFASPFHRLLSYGAAYDYCVANAISTKLPILEKEIEKLKLGLLTFYSSKDKDIKLRMNLRGEDYGANQNLSYSGEKNVNWQD